MIVILAIAYVVLVAVYAWLLCPRAWRAWRRRRLVRTESKRGVATLELMLEERAHAGTPPRRGKGGTRRGESASHPSP
jgi:hypothetical protein